MSGVFLSHVSPGIDSAIARRVHRDLERSGLTVWRFERMAHAVATLDDEVTERIARCSAFIVLDSSRARRSANVRDECQCIADRGRDGVRCPRLVVCSIEPDGRWGDEHALFDSAERIRTIELTAEHYHRGMFDLCRALGAMYVSNFSRPRDEDFLQELDTARVSACEQECLRNAYDRFRRAADSGDVAEAEAAATALGPRVMRLERPLVTPLLAIGTFYHDLGDDAVAECAFGEAVRIAPSEPRAWSGLAAARASLGHFEASFDAYQAAVRLLRGSSNPRHQQGRAQINIEAAAVAGALGNATRAIELLDAAERMQPATAAVLALRGRILRLAGDVAAAYDTLEGALVASTYVFGMSTDVSLDLADCCAELGDVEREEEILVRALKLDAGDSRLQRRFRALRARMSRLDDAVMNS